MGHEKTAVHTNCNDLLGDAEFNLNKTQFLYLYSLIFHHVLKTNKMCNGLIGREIILLAYCLCFAI